MPKYTWKCTECEGDTEVTRRISEYKKPPEECTHCGKETKMERQIASGTNFNLEGDGWFNKGGY